MRFSRRQNFLILLGIVSLSLVVIITVYNIKTPKRFEGKAETILPTTSYVDFRQLVVIYRQDLGGNRLSNEQVQKIKNGLKFAKLFKWRNSYATFNTDLYFLVLDKAPPPTHCQEFWRPLEDDLRSYLLVTYGDENYWNNIFDGIHFTGAGVSCAVGGGGSILGTARVSTGIGRGEAVGRAESGGDLEIDTDAAWYYLIENYRTLDCRWGGPVTDSLHHPHPHEFYQFPGFGCDAHQTSYQSLINAANDWDWDAKTFRASAENGGFINFFRFHLSDFSNALRTAPDQDGDGLPDGQLVSIPPNERVAILERDEQPPVTETEFGSNPRCFDNDQDGYSDLEEFTAGIFTASETQAPVWLSCTGQANVSRVLDHPLYPGFKPSVKKGSPSLDESDIANGGDEFWTLIYDGYFYNEARDENEQPPDFSQKTYAAWDRENFYLAVKTSRPGSLIWLDLDGSGENGYWVGMDSYRLKINRYETEGKVWLYEPGPERMVSGASFVNFGQDGDWVTKIKIPKNLGVGHGFFGENPVGGLTLAPGRILGLRLKVENPGSLRGGLTRLFEEHTFGQLVLEEKGQAPAAPAILETNTEAAPNGLVVRWRTSQPAETVVKYGRTMGLKSIVNKNEGLTTSHEVTLPNLVDGETVFWRAINRPYDGWVYLGPLQATTFSYPPFIVGENLALDRPALSNLDGETGEAVDGIKNNEDGNGWVPIRLNQQMRVGDFWQVDLLGEYLIEGIRVYRDNYQDPNVNPYYHNIPKQFTIYVSSSEEFSQETLVARETNFFVPSPEENSKVYRFTPLRARFVRFVADSNEDWVRLHEFEVLAADQEADLGRISGQIYLEGRQNHAGVKIDLNGRKSETAADGSFSFRVSQGAYTISAWYPGYLGGTREVLVEAGSEILLPKLTLPGGDVTQDKKINIFDLVRIGINYGTNDQTADINGSGWVDIFDLVLVGKNYGTGGVVSW